MNSGGSGLRFVEEFSSFTVSPMPFSKDCRAVARRSPVCFTARQGYLQKTPHSEILAVLAIIWLVCGIRISIGGSRLKLETLCKELAALPESRLEINFIQS